MAENNAGKIPRKIRLDALKQGFYRRKRNKGRRLRSEPRNICRKSEPNHGIQCCCVTHPK
jgi:hypothetical protein